MKRMSKNYQTYHSGTYQMPFLLSIEPWKWLLPAGRKPQPWHCWVVWVKESSYKPSTTCCRTLNYDSLEKNTKKTVVRILKQVLHNDILAVLAQKKFLLKSCKSPEHPDSLQSWLLSCFTKCTVSVSWAQIHSIMGTCLFSYIIETFVLFPTSERSTLITSICMKLCETIKP